MRWLITGAGGFLGGYFCDALARNGNVVVAQCRSHHPPGNVAQTIVADLAETAAGHRVVSEGRPDVVIHCAAMTNVDECERDPAGAQRMNAGICGELAESCTRVGAKLVMISTDQLWRNAKPFATEDLPLDPAGVYGSTKAEGERLVATNPVHLILRTNFFGRGPNWRPSLSDTVLNTLRSGKIFYGFTDVFYTPIDVRIFAQWTVDAIQAGLQGIYHLGGRDRLSKYDFATLLARRAGLDASAIKQSTVAAAGLTTERPCEMSLNSNKISRALNRELPSVEQSIASCLSAT